MISWLVEQIFDDPDNSEGKWGAYAGVVWSITDDGWNNSYYAGASYGGLTAYEALQGAYKQRTDVTGFSVYTPSGSFYGLEFLGPAAEPSTVLLLTLVLPAGVALSSTSARWRKRLSSR